MLIIFSQTYQGQDVREHLSFYQSSKIMMIKKHVASQNSINTEQRSILNMDLCIPA